MRYLVFISFFLFFGLNLYGQAFSEVQKIVTDERINRTEFCTNIQYVGDFAFFGQYKYKKIKSPGDTVFHAGAVYIYKLDSLDRWNYYQKLENPINKVWDNFAWDVKVSNDFTLVVSAYCANSFNCEIVYIYEKNDLDFWELKQEIKPQLINNNYTSNFGFSVAINENYLAISATANRTDENNQNPILGAGAVFIYAKNTSGIWVLNQKIVAPVRKAHNAFGLSLNFNTNMLFVGMPYENTNSNNIQNMGVVFVYILDINSNWVLHQQISPNFREEEALFGRSLKSSDSTLVISAWYGNIDELGDNYVEKSGGVFIFELDESGFWLEKQKLLSEPRLPFQYFGNSLDVHNNIIVVGSALEDNLQFSKTGAVYVYKKNENNSWVLLQKIFPEIPQSNKQFGYAVSIYQEQILVSAIGEMYDQNNENPQNLAGAVYYYKKCTPSFYLDTQTACDQYTWIDGVTYTENNNSATHKIKNNLGCDSIITLDLTINTSIHIVTDATTCTPYTWNNTTYDQSGNYTYQTISTNGCDSIATLDLTIHHRSESASVMASCDSYDWNGQTYTQSGTYTFQTQNVHGCDSVASLFLSISPSFLDTSFVTTCDDYTWSGNTYNQSGTYTWSGQTTSGCDSIMTLVLNLQNTIETEENITACDSYEWNGNTFTSSGMYTHQTISSLGCDSIVTLYLEVFPTVVVEENLTACDILVWHGQTYDESGFYTHQSQTFNGCDSITQLYLTILPSSVTNLTAEACESYTWNGQTYQSSGSYTHQSTNHLGCDSTVVLDLTIHQKTTSSTVILACDVYEWNGNSYSQSGTYDFSSLNQSGCDSTAILELTIHPSYEVPLSLSDCVSVDYSGNSYTESGMYPISLQSQFGCDSIVRLDVRILSERYEEVQTSCDSFYWPVGDQYFDQSGVYQQTFTNIDGCDSTFSLTLEINPSYKETETITTCDTYQWNVNQNTYTESGLFEFRTQTQKGCDSLRLLQLNIEKSFEQRDTITTTTTYQWPINNQEYNQSGNYELRYTSINGCDSLYFLVLRINQDFEVLFPNIISSQGGNGKFKPYSQHPQILLKKLSVFDRMASRVYHIENVYVQDENYGWDGRFNGALVIPGVYAWISEVVFPDGSVKQMVGDLTVLR